MTHWKHCESDRGLLLGNTSNSFGFPDEKSSQEIDNLVETYRIQSSVANFSRKILGGAIQPVALDRGQDRRIYLENHNTY